MPYLGNEPAVAYTSTTKDTFSGDASTTDFTMSKSANVNAVRVVVENVIQDPTVAYTCSGTTLSFTSAPPTGTNNIYVVHLGPPAATVAPPSTINNPTTFTGGVTVKTADNSTQLTLESTDADATFGPVLDLYRNSSSPADADATGRINFKAENDAGETITYAQAFSSILDVTDGTEDGRYKIGTMVAGSFDSRMDMTNTETVFNEDSKDLDFRIEGNSATSMFHVDALNDRIGVGVNDPDAVLDVSGASAGGNVLGILRVVQRVSGAAAYGLDVGLDPTTGDPVFSRVVNDTVTESFRIVRSNGEVDIGGHTHSGDNMLQIASPNLSGTRGGISVQNKTDNSGGYFLAFYRSSSALIGSISQSAQNAVAYNTSSDYRLKENVNYSFDATTRLKQLKPCIFNWINDEDNTPVDGFLAHEVSSIVPEAITGEKDATEEIGIIKDSDGNTIKEKASKPSDLDEGNTWTATGTQPVYQGIDQSKLVPILVKTIQELEARITALEAE